MREEGIREEGMGEDGMERGGNVMRTEWKEEGKER